MNIIFLRLFLQVVILNLAAGVVSDKEYARLPPVFELDHFDRCMLLEDEALYCSVEFHLEPIDPKNVSTTWKQIQELSTSERNYDHDNLRHGICIPFSCPNISISHKDPKFKDELAECYSKKYTKMGLHGKIGYMHCQTNEPLPFDFVDKATIILLVVYIILVFYASFYEGLARYKTPEEYQRITGTSYGKLVSCFSIPKNWLRLRTVVHTPDTERLKGIQGVRLYNMIVVIMVHASMLALIGPVSNTKWPENIYDQPILIFFASGVFGVETFFIISSWLLTYSLFMKFNEKSGKELDVKTILWVIMNRYLRLIPPYALVILLHSGLLYHSGNGPWWDIMVGRDLRNCRENAWTNFLFINNVVNPERMCIIEAWYLAADMQAFILVLIVLYFSVKKPQRLKWILPTVVCMSQGILLYRLYDKKIFSVMKPFPESMYHLRELFRRDGVWINTLADTIPNIVGTVVGIVAGYAFYIYRNQQIFTKKIHVVLWWMYTFGGGISIILLPGMWLFSDNFYPTYWFVFPYYGLSSLIYGFAVALGYFGVGQGIGWMTKWTLEWSPTYVLGRITYCSYLAHYPLIIYASGISRHLVYIDIFGVFSHALQIAVLSLIIGLILTLTIELPTSALQAAFLNPRMAIESEKPANDENEKVKSS